MFKFLMPLLVLIPLTTCISAPTPSAAYRPKCYPPQPHLLPAVFRACKTIIFTIPTASGPHDPSVPLKFSPDRDQRPDVRLPAAWGKGNRECNIALQFGRDASVRYDMTTLNDVQGAALAVAMECVIRPPHLGGYVEVGWRQRMAVNVLNMDKEVLGLWAAEAEAEAEAVNGTVATA